MSRTLLRGAGSRGGDRVGHGDAEVGGAVRVPAQLLDPGVAVRVVQRVAGDLLVLAGVVDEDVTAAVLGDREAVVAGAVLLGGVVAGEDGGRRLGPVGGVHQVGVR